MDSYLVPLVALAALCTAIAIVMVCYGKYPEENKEECSEDGH